MQFNLFNCSVSSDELKVACKRISRISQSELKILFSFLKVQRSASQSDVHGSNTRRLRPTTIGNQTTKLKRCASLPAQKRQIIVTTNVDVKNLKTQLESSVESLGKSMKFSVHVTFLFCLIMRHVKCDFLFFWLRLNKTENAIYLDSIPSGGKTVIRVTTPFTPQIIFPFVWIF